MLWLCIQSYGSVFNLMALYSMLSLAKLLSERLTERQQAAGRVGECEQGGEPDLQCRQGSAMQVPSASLEEEVVLKSLTMEDLDKSIGEVRTILVSLNELVSCLC